MKNSNPSRTPRRFRKFEDGSGKIRWQAAWKDSLHHLVADQGISYFLLMHGEGPWGQVPLEDEGPSHHSKGVCFWQSELKHEHVWQCRSFCGALAVLPLLLVAQRSTPSPSPLNFFQNALLQFVPLPRSWHCVGRHGKLFSHGMYDCAILEEVQCLSNVCWLKILRHLVEHIFTQ